MLLKFIALFIARSANSPPAFKSSTVFFKLKHKERSVGSALPTSFDLTKQAFLCMAEFRARLSPEHSLDHAQSQKDPRPL
jgi:hypothetical protein